MKKPHRNFKLNPELNQKLIEEAKKRNTTQTALLEDALRNYLTPTQQEAEVKHEAH